MTLSKRTYGICAVVTIQCVHSLIEIKYLKGRLKGRMVSLADLPVEITRELSRIFDWTDGKGDDDNEDEVVAVVNKDELEMEIEEGDFEDEILDVEDSYYDDSNSNSSSTVERNQLFQVLTAQVNQYSFWLQCSQVQYVNSVANNENSVLKINDL